MRTFDLAALTARAAPGVPDPAQPVALSRVVVLAQANRTDDDVVMHRSQYPHAPVIRLCVGCGVVRECDPALPCAECNASPFHLIPTRPRS